MKRFSHNLRTLMAKRKINQVELAKLSGVKQQYISRYLNEDPQGKFPRDIETMLALCAALNCSLYDLTGISELKNIELTSAKKGGLTKEALEIAKRYDKLQSSDPCREQVKNLLLKSK